MACTGPTGSGKIVSMEPLAAYGQTQVSNVHSTSARAMTVCLADACKEPPEDA